MAGFEVPGDSWDCGLNDQDCGQFTAPDGTQVAFANTGLVLYQTLTNLLTAGGQYSLTVAVGTRANLVPCAANRLA